MTVMMVVTPWWQCIVEYMWTVGLVFLEVTVKVCLLAETAIA